MLCAAWLLIHLPLISAQEISLSESQSEEVQIEIRDPYSGEQELILGGSADGNEAAAGQSGGTSVWYIVRMVLVLILAAAAIYGIVFLFKRASKKAPDNDPFLKVLANVHLGANRYAHVVSVGSKAWLLGASDGGVNLIGEVDDKEIIDAMLLEDSRKISQSSGKLPDFLAILRRLGAPAQPNASGVDEIRKRRERLGGL